MSATWMKGNSKGKVLAAYKYMGNNFCDRGIYTSKLLQLAYPYFHRNRHLREAL